MKDAINEFLDYIYYEKKYSDNTETGYEIDLYKYKAYLEKCHKDYLKIKYEDVSNFVMDLKKAGYKPTTINRSISTLRSFYTYLEKIGKISSNPFKMTSNVKMEKRLPNYFKYNEFEMMINTLDDSPLGIRNRLILELLLATGMRVSELSNVQIKSINFADYEIKIIGKGNKERVVFYGKYAHEALTSYLNNSRKILLAGKESDYLLINNGGTKLTARGIRLIIENIVKKAAISSKVTPHTFRHTFATIMLNEGCNIKSVQELLGHASLSTTGIYTHLTNEEIRKVYLNMHPRAKR